MNLYGGKISEIIAMMNAVTRDPNTEWHSVNGQLVKQTTVAGITLRMRKIMDIGAMFPRQVSITGKGWMISMMVNKRRPTKLKPDDFGEMVDLAISRDTMAKAYIHTVSVISPDAFRNEMAVLRTFEAMWNRG